MKKFMIVFSLVITVAIGIYFYTYQSHRDIATEKPDYSLTLSDLQKDFETNDSLFNAKYADKTIEIYGKITAIDLKNKSIMLDDKIAISLDTLEANSLKISDTTFIKGRYVGFDDLLEEFKIDQAIILKK
jgi:hypothetical protein